MVNWDPVTEPFGTQTGRSRYVYIYIHIYFYLSWGDDPILSYVSKGGRKTNANLSTCLAFLKQQPFKYYLLRPWKCLKTEYPNRWFGKVIYTVNMASFGIFDKFLSCIKGGRMVIDSIYSTCSHELLMFVRLPDAGREPWLCWPRCGRRWATTT